MKEAKKQKKRSILSHIYEDMVRALAELVSNN